MRRNTVIALSALLPLLAACGTPQEQCISRNTSEYRAVSSLLAQVEGNLARGYAWGEREITREHLTQCRDYVRDRDGNVRQILTPCYRSYTDTQQFRVPIDPAAETRKRDNLAKRRDSLARSAQAAVSACRAAYPEGQ